ncbi:MAG: amidase [Armatimonadota bacterium]|nr:amidase [Armatimonadota bacterium]
MSDLWWLSLAEVALRIRNREVSPVEVVQTLLERIARVDKGLNSFLRVLADEALVAARQAEDALSRTEELGLLHGVPIAVKDMIHVRGTRTTCGSKIMADFVAQEDATVVKRLRENGAIILGKTNLHEFAYGVTNINPHYGPARNPWDPDRISGGSSGGSAVAVAAGLCYGALGTDTGGSIRIPAALCGVVGLKPTFGRVSRYGVVPLAWSLDHVGPITRTVEDARLMFQVIAGYDPMDPTTSKEPLPDLRGLLDGEIRGVRVGVIRTMMEDADPQVRSLVQDALKVLTDAGAEVEEVAIPSLQEMRTAAMAIAMPEASAYHLRWLSQRSLDYGEDVRQRLFVGALLPAHAYLTGLRARQWLRKQLQEVFERVQVLVAPTVSAPACPIGAQTLRVGEEERDPRAAYLWFNQVFNMVGLPSISVPCGFVRHLPVGMQIIGRWFAEGEILSVARAFERGAIQIHRRPPVD